MKKGDLVYLASGRRDENDEIGENHGWLYICERAPNKNKVVLAKSLATGETLALSAYRFEGFTDEEG